MQESWIQWRPLDNLSGKYNLDSLMHIEEGLVLRLSLGVDCKKLEIRFEHQIDAYRYTNDSFCFKVCGDLTKKYGLEFYAEWSFFTITNSDYLQWVSKNSQGYADAFSFIHFCIVGADEIVDVLARYEPIVRFIE